MQQGGGQGMGLGKNNMHNNPNVTWNMENFG